jgi:phage gp46-like protein
MTDIALIWDEALGEADLQLSGADLRTDLGLHAAAIISLFTDRTAELGDPLPDGSADRRGWWGDMPVDPAAQDQTAPPDRIGSRLWLLARGLETDETLARAQTYASEALGWMTADGVAGSVAATVSFPVLGRIELDIAIAQAGSSAAFTLAWRNS